MAFPTGKYELQGSDLFIIHPMASHGKWKNQEKKKSFFKVEV